MPAGYCFVLQSMAVQHILTRNFWGNLLFTLRIFKKERTKEKREKEEKERKENVEDMREKIDTHRYGDNGKTWAPKFPKGITNENFLIF